MKVKLSEFKSEPEVEFWLKTANQMLTRSQDSCVFLTTMERWKIVSVPTRVRVVSLAVLVRTETAAPSKNQAVFVKSERRLCSRHGQTAL